MSGKLRAAAESALAIMKRNADRIDFDKEIADLEVALAKPKQDPVAWRYQNGITKTEYLVWQKGTGGRNWTPLYAAQPRKEWVGLTDEDMQECIKTADYNQGQYKRTFFWANLATAIEQRLKEKNT